MKKYYDIVKEKLNSIIEDMANDPKDFVQNPDGDFVRKRKLDFQTMVKIILSMNGGSIGKELLSYFKFDTKTATASAFQQQRFKILPEAFEHLFKTFTKSFSDCKTFNNYRLLAVDGSRLNIAHNPNDLSTYVKLNDGKGCNMLLLNTIFDLCNKLYVDAIIQPIKNQNENLALRRMVDRLDVNEKAIIIADRGYENYNAFAHIEQKGLKYIIRVRDKESRGIAASLKALPHSDIFDEKIALKLTRQQTKAIKLNSDYKFLPSNVIFDYLEAGSTNIYEMNFRVVRFKMSENTYETIITNLDEHEFDANMIKELYHMRWGIETSFRELKYAVGLVNFHAKKVEFIKQEVFAKLTMHNFCKIITLNVVVNNNKKKHLYQINFTFAIYVCIHFFRHSLDEYPLDLETLIQQKILPVRAGRSDMRKLRAKSFVSFLYRVA